MTDVWIALETPDAAALAAALPVSVHSSVTERMLAECGADTPRPRLETHDDYVFGVFMVPVHHRPDVDHDDDSVNDDPEVIHHEIDVVVTETTIVTVYKAIAGTPPLDLSLLRAAATRNGHSPGMCLFDIVDHVAEQFLDVVDAFDSEIDELEDNVENWPSARIRERMSHLRHDMLQVRRALTPTRDAARSVLDDRVELEGHELFPRDVELHFADTYDKLLRATDGLDLARDLLAGVRDYHQAKVANDQNDVMKKLTVIASMVLLPTFVVGLYGQNLKGAPELNWAHGYLWSWGLIVVTTVLQAIYFRRKGWI